MFEFGDLTEEEASSRRRAMVDRVLIALIDDRHRQIMKAYNLSEDFMASAPAPGAEPASQLPPRARVPLLAAPGVATMDDSVLRGRRQVRRTGP